MIALRPAVAALASLLATMAGVVGTAQAAPLDLEVIPAWDGWSRPGRITEAEVRLRSQDRESASVTISADGDTVRTRVALQPGQLSSVFVPVPAAEAVRVQARRKGHEVETRETRLALSESPLLAWVAPGPVQGSMTGFHAVVFDPGRLPRTASAYSSIDALVIDRALLPSLTQDQLASLLSYLAGCGRTILISASPADEGLFRTAVGCGGRSFAAVADAGDVGRQLDRVLATPQESPLEATSLATIDRPDLRSLSLVVTVLAVCAAATVLAGIFTTSLVAAVVVPVLAAAGALGFVQTRQPDSRLVVWAESGASERVARYRGLQQASVMSRGRVEVPVLAALARPQSCRSADGASWTWDAAERRFSAVRLEGRLFSSVALCYSGEFPVARAAAVRPASNGRIALANAGASTSPEGLLAWNGRLFPVAPLRPGEEVQIAPDGGTRATGGPQGLALTRTPPDAQSILWPLDMRRVPGAPAQSQAWLLLRVEPVGPG
jgi:hypothetical protein